MCVLYFLRSIKEKRQIRKLYFLNAYIFNDKINITLLGHNLFDFYFVHVISYHTLHRFNVTSIINIMPFQVFY